MLREVCRQHHAWQAEGVPLLPIALKVSIAQLRRPEFSQTFRTIMTGEGVDPRWITIEITESIIMDNAELFGRMLSELLRTARAFPSTISEPGFRA